MKRLLSALLATLLGTLLMTAVCDAAEHTVFGPHKDPKYQHQGCPAACPNCGPAWNCGYYNVQWGSPVALVVPPTAEKYREMGWGVGNTRMRRIYPQFGPGYPGTTISSPVPAFSPTPPWPSDTTQFGIYYVRGPWDPR